MRWIWLVGFSGFVAASAQAADQYPGKVCVDISKAEQVTSITFANSPRERALARTALLVLLRDRCGVNVDAKLLADDAAMEGVGVTVGRGKQ
jgi:hypothetical protein